MIIKQQQKLERNRRKKTEKLLLLGMFIDCYYHW